MKRFLFLLFGGIILSIFLQCKTTSFKTSDIAKEWMLVEFNKYSKEEFIHKKAKIIIHPSVISLLKGEIIIDCHHFSFMGRIMNKEKFKIIKVERVGADCEESYLEKDFFQKFYQLSAYKREGHFLTLVMNDGSSMKFLESDWD